jgi:hypothetical protein
MLYNYHQGIPLKRGCLDNVLISISSTLCEPCSTTFQLRDLPAIKPLSSSYNQKWHLWTPTYVSAHSPSPYLPKISTSNETTAAQTVSWQTLYWTLIPLALNTMAQPCGKVCRQPSRHRTYLRSSPFICAADSPSITIHLITYLYTLSIRGDLSIKDSMKLLIQERSRDVEEKTEGARALENLTWSRWLFFILETLGPAIKLTAMTGIPYTKGGGGMFLSSFLIVEKLIVLSWNLDQRPLHLETEAQETLQSMRATLKVIDEFLHALACFVHILLMIWASFFLVNRRSIFQAFQYHWSVFRDWKRLSPETSGADRLQIEGALFRSFLGHIFLALKILDPHICVL